LHEGGVHTGVLLTDREGSTCPPPFTDVADFLTVARGLQGVTPECRRLLGEWLRGGDGGPEQIGASRLTPSRRRLTDSDVDSRLFTALVAAALQCRHRAAICQERGYRCSAARHQDEAHRMARKGLHLLRRLRMRGADGMGTPRHDSGSSGLGRTGADTASRRRF
jgi:hypothetical protein